ncbi:hypothetical protein PsYK624_153660 [Phanerochaete sordida]|uniref:Uncharacterized protein n=1 Tax=Phanerochaete sordida TaxID=48140 RepID=A0A9P3GT32_9APHY|nr:hypothetical protein PsYK624_153660 [Phanerochaete sordida]
MPQSERPALQQFWGTSQIPSFPACCTIKTAKRLYFQYIMRHAGMRPARPAEELRFIRWHCPISRARSPSTHAITRTSPDRKLASSALLLAA